MSQPMWTITGISQTTQFDAANGPRPARRVDFTTMTGHTGHVVIPDSEFKPETVATKVHDMATNMVNVAMLEGPVMYHPESVVE